MKAEWIAVFPSLVDVLMAGLDYQAKCIDSQKIVTIFAVEGVQFLLSGEGKVSINFGNVCSLSNIYICTATRNLNLY